MKKTIFVTVALIISLLLNCVCIYFFFKLMYRYRDMEEQSKVVTHTSLIIDTGLTQYKADSISLKGDTAKYYRNGEFVGYSVTEYVK